MGKLKTYIKRGLKYIRTGAPNVTIHVDMAQVQYGGMLAGKHVLITGGTRGLGFAIAKRCVEEKAMVTITGRTMEGLTAAKEKLGNPENLFLLTHDIRNYDADAEVVERAAELMGGLDILLNNAGISIHGISYATCSQQQWDDQMDTNLKGVYFMTQAFLNYYEAHKLQNGKILMMVSERGLYGDDVPYGLAKRALISYTEGLAVRLIRKGIRVNAIAPGVTATDMTGYSAEGDLYRQWAQGRRVLLPEEIAEVALFMMSDAASCISGQVIACNEANHLKP